MTPRDAPRPQRRFWRRAAARKRDAEKDPGNREVRPAADADSDATARRRRPLRRRRRFLSGLHFHVCRRREMKEAAEEEEEEEEDP